MVVTLAPQIMKHDIYELLVVSGNLGMIDFVSAGPQRRIVKRIRIYSTPKPEIFHVLLADVGRGGKSDDMAMNNNGDRDRILATVVYVIELYTLRYPERWIYFSGNTKLKNRLYRMFINKRLGMLASNFYIYGDVNKEIKPFSPGVDADGFLVKRMLP